MIRLTRAKTLMSSQTTYTLLQKSCINAPKQSQTLWHGTRLYFSTKPDERTGSSSEDEPEVQIELDEEYKATHQEPTQGPEGGPTEQTFGRSEQRYDFKSKRVTITNFKSVKSDKVSTIQIDGKDKKVRMLATEKNRLTPSEIKLRAYHILAETYLPKDYPESVSKEFLPFTIYSLIGGISTSAMFFLSTQSLFVALGGSSSQSQLAAAAYTWVLKDGIGQLGGILFASRYGGYFDEDIKKWRFFAISTLNLAILIEILTLKFPSLFLFLASTANMGKNICFLMAAASRARINMQFAKRNNIADIAGKSVSIFTTSSLLGMGVGMGFSKLIDISQLSQMAPVFAILTAINLYTTYVSADLIDEKHLNNQRAKLLFDQYFSPGNDRMPTMVEINKQSNFTLPNFLNWHYCKFVQFGDESVPSLIGRTQPNYYTTSLLHQLHKEDRQFVYYIQLLPWWKRPFARLINNGRPYTIHLNMSKRAENKDQLGAYYLARLIDLEMGKLFASESKRVSYTTIQNCIRVAELNYSQVNIEQFIEELQQQDWAMDYIYLDRQKNLYEFKLEHVQPLSPAQEEDSLDEEEMEQKL